jgi:glycosyltransferase involved in cell wall biosynthesis
VNLELSDVTRKRVVSGASRRVRVLHVNAGNLYGGVETLLTTLAAMRHVCPGLEPHFATCYEGRSSRELMAAGVPVYMLGETRISRPWTVWRARRLLRQVLQKEHFDLVICHMAWSLVLFGGVARGLQQRVALWAHGFQSGEHWLERIARRTTPDLAIANSRFTAANLRDHYPKTPTQVIYCPMALVDLAEADRCRAAVRHEQGVDDDTAVILQVSRLEPLKGQLVHLRALAQLMAAPKWVCWIAGGPQTRQEEKYFRELQETAYQLGIAERVRFLGERADVPKLLAGADIYSQPNQAPEGFGLVFVEALWAGRPVISSAIGGVLEIVDDSCGLLVAPGDTDALAGSLRLLIESPEVRQRLGEAGVARARWLCDPTTQMEKLREVSEDKTGHGGWS